MNTPIDKLFSCDIYVIFSIPTKVYKKNETRHSREAFLKARGRRSKPLGVACAACLERLARRFRQPRCVQDRNSSLTEPSYPYLETLKHIKPSRGVSNAFERALRSKSFHLKTRKTLLRVSYLTSACFKVCHLTIVVRFILFQSSFLIETTSVASERAQRRV